MSSTPKVFISYSHKDEAYRERLTTFLKIFGLTAVFSTWDDGEIHPSEDWRARIQTAMDEAQIAVLLISADFLASDFIQDHEIPRLETTKNLVEPLKAGRHAHRPSLTSRASQTMLLVTLQNPIS